MMSGASGLLLVHAHPDDESINNGVTMAACAGQGVRVALVTCTRGEEGEIIPAGLAGLAADRDDALGPQPPWPRWGSPTTASSAATGTTAAGGTPG
jgi:N-acetyl-1-D-myo-inositol-2-amino-2-deoxy-alpha-D-glucopyranoside deacetylase